MARIEAGTGVRRRLRGGFLAVVGYILSPLSWWNDAFINLPLAWLFASVVSLAWYRLFMPAMIVGYWLTNILGLALMAQGTSDITGGDRKQLRLTLLAGTVYTLLVVVLYLLHVIKPIHALFGPGR
jgi:hypothetical protein